MQGAAEPRCQSTSTGILSSRALESVRRRCLAGDAVRNENFVLVSSGITGLGAHGAPARERSGAQGSPRATEPGSGAEPRLVGRAPGRRTPPRIRQPELAHQYACCATARGTLVRVNLAGRSRLRNKTDLALRRRLRRWRGHCHVVTELLLGCNGAAVRVNVSVG